MLPTMLRNFGRVRVHCTCRASSTVAKMSQRMLQVDGGKVVLLTHPLLPSLPMLGLGTADNGGGDEIMAGAVATASQHGVRLFDTAQNYGSEAALGEGLRRAGLRPNRPSRILSSKTFGHICSI